MNFRRETITQWNNDPCGLSGAKDFPCGTKEFYAAVDKNRYEEYAPWMKDELEFAGYPGKKVLEVGFGMGTDLFQFALGGSEVHGVDLTPKHREIAAKRFAVYGIPVELRLANAENIPFADETFDVVYTFGVIHHIPDTQKTVDEIHRVLKPGGRAIIGVYHRYSAYYLLSLWLFSYVLNLRFLVESHRRLLSKIEYRENSHACPLVKLYNRNQLHAMLRNFADVRISCRHLERDHFGKFARFVPAALIRILERRLGWYLIAKCVK